uniref:DNA helicase B winged helix domain-containing protein n=1 Tax=Oncorhynchus tshawytscha TaxID=74940 RepID=A0A8C8IY32_ONCTS
MSQLWCPVGDRILVGYILPEKKVKNSENDDSDWEDDDEEEEEEAQPEFLDMKEMDSVSSGGHVFNSSVPGRNEGEWSCRVLGRFSLKDPWWEATCTARAARGKLVLRGYPAYRLRSDLQGGSDLQGDPDHSVLSLFLTACGVDAQFVVPFFAWLPMGRKLEFANLQEVLAEFEEGEQHRALAQQIKALLMSSVCLSVAGMRVTAASLYPHVMRYLPTLLPGRFTELLSRGKKKEDLSLLAKIEEMIKTDVWKLGFNYVMYKELKVVHCEAQLRSFHECKLFQEIPLKQRNALRVYDSLKNHCYRTGSTYTELPPCVTRSGEGVAPWWRWRYEEHRTNTSVHFVFYVLFAQTRGPPPVDLGPDQGPPPVDLDPDQVRAAKMICFNPVTVISGKGGCGKTTVVSLVFKAALQQSPEKEVRKACWDFENDSLGSEAWEEADGEDEVLLTAPTGRAASLLTKRTCFKAYTLHQVGTGDSSALRMTSRMEWKFACVRVLVVDEGSLVCVQLLHSVLTMLTKHAQLRKFVILGDVRQLSSIQPGNTLYDLFHSLGRAHWAIEMRTNHRAESQLIVDNVAIELLLKAAPGLKNDATSQFIWSDM